MHVFQACGSDGIGNFILKICTDFITCTFMQQGGIMLANQRVCLRFAFSTNQNARNS